MRLNDKTLTCLDCEGHFIFTAGEQEMLRLRGRDEEPSRCPRCYHRVGGRQARRDLPEVYLRAPIER